MGTCKNWHGWLVAAAKHSHGLLRHQGTIIMRVVKRLQLKCDACSSEFSRIAYRHRRSLVAHEGKCLCPSCAYTHINYAASNAKRMQTLLTKYGVTCPVNIPGVRPNADLKRTQTMMQRYGVKSPFQMPHAIQNRKMTSEIQRQKKMRALTSETQPATVCTP